MLDRLKNYFENTSEAQIKKDWEATEKYDDVNSPKVDEFLEELNKNIKMETLLWLDDIRNPFIPTYINQYKQLKNIRDINNDFNPTHKYEVQWVRNYEEMKEWIAHFGLPDYISFDHDLADEHYTPPKYWNDYQASKEYQDAQDYKEKTGLDCAKMVVEYCMDNNLELPHYFSHSANPVGRDNILHYLNNFKKSRENA